MYSSGRVDYIGGQQRFGVKSGMESALSNENNEARSPPRSSASEHNGEQTKEASEERIITMTSDAEISERGLVAEDHCYQPAQLWFQLPSSTRTAPLQKRYVWIRPRAP